MVNILEEDAASTSALQMQASCSYHSDKSLHDSNYPLQKTGNVQSLQYAQFSHTKVCVHFYKHTMEVIIMN
jgi:hypothetical protein